MPESARGVDFAIREEQDLEDSGAYGTTPSRKADETLQRGDEVAMLVCSTNFEDEPPQPSLSQSITISTDGAPRLKPPLASGKQRQSQLSSKKPPTAQSRRSNHQPAFVATTEEKSSLESSTFNERVSLNDHFVIPPKIRPKDPQH